MHVYDWLSDMGIDRPPVDDGVGEVGFKGVRRGFFRNPAGLTVHAGDYVVVEADRGLDFATVHMTGELVELKLRRSDDTDVRSLPKLIRIAEDQDIRQWQKNRDVEGEAIQTCRGMVERLKLQMKVADVEWQFDRKKVTFFFTAERRVDFRQLVRDLAGKFRTRVELRQIGVRDEAARLGGIGSCGRELCCSTWLEDFKPVTTQAAKAQDLPLNPIRLSGQCGRLQCCLNYELEQYMAALDRLPSAGQRVRVRGKIVRVLKVDIFRDRILVEDPSGEELDVGIDEVEHKRTR
jgi:cell fate regulator YaaT (PSP1 superfamily)